MAILQQQNPELLALLAATFQCRNEPQFALANAISTYLSLPGLVGFWPMSSIDSANNGDVFDLSGNGRTLSNTNTVTADYDGITPYTQYTSGSANRLVRADEAGLDILGTEVYIGTKGLTVGGWFYFDLVPAIAEAMISKYDTNANQRSWFLQRRNTGFPQLAVSSDGTGANTFSAISTEITLQNSWSYVVGRYTPSSELAIFVNGTKDINTTTIPAAIFNSTAQLAFSGISATPIQLYSGRTSMAFLCASALSDTIIQSTYQQTRGLFGN